MLHCFHFAAKVKIKHDVIIIVNGVVVGLSRSLQTLWKVAGFVNSLGGKVKKAYDLQKAFTDDGSEKIEEILSKVAEVSDQIGGFESRLTQRLDMMVESLVSRITLTEKLNNAISDVHKNIVNVDEMWSNYLAYSKNLTNFSNNTIKAFIDSATRAHDGLQSWLSQLYGLFIPGRTGPIMESLFTTMLKLEGETALLICDGGLSPQQELYQMYHMAALTELRGFIMAVSAYGLQSTFDGEKYQGEVDIIETRLVSRIQDYILAVTAAMKVASNTIRRCDPKGGHREGHTYIQLHRLFQSYLVNEADIDPQEKCMFDCTLQEPVGKNRRRVNYPHTYRDQPNCNGAVTYCVPATRKLDICIENGGFPNRYKWIKQADGKVWGNDSECHGFQQTLSSWPRGLFSCDYCLCNCEALRTGDPTVAIINFLPSEANIQNNMVVVGVQIVKKESVIHIQIKEGKLQPEGMILKGSERWVPLKDLNHLQSGTYSHGGRNGGFPNRYKWIKQADGKVWGNDSECHGFQQTLSSWPRGVRFRHSRDPSIEKYNPIRLEVLSIPFDYAAGNLSLKESARWISAEPPRAREELTFDHPGHPGNNFQNLPTTKPNLFVQFQKTDLKKDAGQTAIPFWDIQPVVTSPSSPLEGVGLFHKGDKERKYGGYLALRLHTYNFIDHISANLPETLKHKYQNVLSKLLGSPMGIF
ncbi:uncharacterized protein LOC114841198 [Diachasma alloeum]|uniref:uncharacterized protein LOC114841198 n=1 Tax=Diachasma alloeum TaxID=454923 RepID=UPI0010FB46D1|nr:uncharacterized protein LOC114841198 [Diachasma alloeum]